MKTTLHIEGMSCAKCVHHVKEALEDVSGVKEAEVSLPQKMATVEHDEAITAAALKAAVVEAGYEVVD